MKKILVLAEKVCCFLSCSNRLQISRRTGNINKISSLNPDPSMSISNLTHLDFLGPWVNLGLPQFFNYKYFHYNGKDFAHGIPIWIPLHLLGVLPGNQLWFKTPKKSKQLGKFYEVFQVVGVFLEPQQSTFRQALPWCLTTNGWESFSLKNSNT